MVALVAFHSQVLVQGSNFSSNLAALPQKPYKLTVCDFYGNMPLKLYLPISLHKKKKKEVYSVIDFFLKDISH